MTLEQRDEARYYAADEDRVQIVCRHCGDNAHVIKRDMGIGAYEYWGSCEVHRDMRDCCSECGEEL